MLFTSSVTCSILSIFDITGDADSFRAERINECCKWLDIGDSKRSGAATLYCAGVGIVTDPAGARVIASASGCVAVTSAGVARYAMFGAKEDTSDTLTNATVASF
jgi:hypothetical protein